MLHEPMGDCFYWGAEVCCRDFLSTLLCPNTGLKRISSRYSSVDCAQNFGKYEGSTFAKVGFLWADLSLSLIVLDPTQGMGGDCCGT